MTRESRSRFSFLSREKRASGITTARYKPREYRRIGGGRLHRPTTMQRTTMERGILPLSPVGSLAYTQRAYPSRSFRATIERKKNLSSNDVFSRVLFTRLGRRDSRRSVGLLMRAGASHHFAFVVHDIGIRDSVVRPVSLSLFLSFSLRPPSSL